MLESETRKMEEKLELVKRMMELEKEKRSTQVANSKTGTMWRGASTKQGIKGYSDKIVNDHKKNQPVLPPTSKVTRTEQAVRKSLQKPTKVTAAG